MIPMKEENPTGLHARYVIRKVVGRTKTNFGHGYKLKTKAVDPNAEYFILRLDKGGSDPEHIRACRIAIQYYADAIEKHLPDLAKDLRERYPINETP